MSFSLSKLFFAVIIHSSKCTGSGVAWENGLPPPTTLKNPTLFYLVPPYCLIMFILWK